MDVLGELVVRPHARRRGDRPASGRSSSRRSAPTSTTRRSTPRSCSSRRCSATGRWVARSAATRPASAPCRRRRSATSGASTYRPANTVVAVAGDLDHDEARRAGVGGVRDRQRRAARGSSPRPTLPAGAAGPDRPARHDPGAALRRASRRCRATIPTRGRSPCSTPCSATGCRAACSSRVREAKGSPTTSRSGVVEYADAGALEVSAGVDPAAAGRRSRRSSRELARLRDEPVPDEELAKAKAYLSGGLELRMEETRHLASWIGGQEALHDRVLTLDEALAASRRDGRRTSSARRRAVPRRGAAAGGRRAGAAPARPRAPPAAAGMTPGRRRPRGPPPRAGSPALRLARVHLRLGLAAAGPRGARGPAPGAARSTTRRSRPRRGALADRRPRGRRRGGDGLPRGGGSDDASRCASRPRRRGRSAGPARRGGSPDRAIEPTGGSLDPLFAGMPRSAIWPAEAPASADGVDEPHPGLGGGRLRVAAAAVDASRAVAPRSPAATRRPASLRLAVALRLEPGSRESVLEAVGRTRSSRRSRSSRRRAAAAGPRDGGAGGVRRRRDGAGSAGPRRPRRPPADPAVTRPPGGDDGEATPTTRRRRRRAGSSTGARPAVARYPVLPRRAFADHRPPATRAATPKRPAPRRSLRRRRSIDEACANPMPELERTLVLVKPDGVQRLLVGRILARYEERGLKLVGLKLMHVDRAPRRAALRGPSREAVLRGPGGLHHVGAARRGRARGAERDRDRPRDERRDAPARGGAGLDPRRLRGRDGAEPGPRLGQRRRTRPRSSRCGSARGAARATSARSTAGCSPRPSRVRRGEKRCRPAARSLTANALRSGTGITVVRGSLITRSVRHDPSVGRAGRSPPLGPTTFTLADQLAGVGVRRRVRQSVEGPDTIGAASLAAPPMSSAPQDVRAASTARARTAAASSSVRSRRSAAAARRARDASIAPASDRVHATPARARRARWWPVAASTRRTVDRRTLGRRRGIRRGVGGPATGRGGRPFHRDRQRLLAPRDPHPLGRGAADAAGRRAGAEEQQPEIGRQRGEPGERDQPRDAAARELGEVGPRLEGDPAGQPVGRDGGDRQPGAQDRRVAQPAAQVRDRPRLEPVLHHRRPRRDRGLRGRQRDQPDPRRAPGRRDRAPRSPAGPGRRRRSRGSPSRG